MFKSLPGECERGASWIKYYRLIRISCSSARSHNRLSASASRSGRVRVNPRVYKLAAGLSDDLALVHGVRLEELHRGIPISMGTHSARNSSGYIGKPLFLSFFKLYFFLSIFCVFF